MNTCLKLVLLLLVSASVAWADITPQLRVTRTSGVAPLSVFFDASESTSTLTQKPYLDLHYSWEYPNSQAGSWPVSGKPKNKASGPIAGFVFDAPGSYTVTLTVRDTSGNSESLSRTINVRAPSIATTVCVTKSGSYDGCPGGAHKVPASGFLQTQVSSLVSEGYRRIMLEEDNPQNLGSRAFLASEPIKLGIIGLDDSDPGEITSYGPNGARALIKLTNERVLFRVKGEDWRLNNIKVQGHSDGSEILWHDGQSVKRLLVKDLLAVPYTFNKGFVLVMHSTPANASLHSENAFVNNKIVGIGLGPGGNNIFFGALRDSFFSGNHFKDSRGGEHIVRVQHSDGVLFTHNYLAHQAHDKAVLNFRALTPEHGLPGVAEIDYWTQKMYVGDNRIESSADRGFSLTSETDAGGIPKGRLAVVENNFFKQYLANSIQGHIGVLHSEDVAVRNNILACNEDEMLGYRPIHIRPNRAGPASNPSRIDVVNNVVCDLDEGHTARLARIKSGPGEVRVHNNILYAPNANNLILDDQNDDTLVSNNLFTAINPFISSNPLDNPLDYQLAPTSTNAIDQGLSLASVISDFYGGARPAGNAYDIGVHEFGSVGSGDDGFRLSANDDTPQPGETLTLTIEGGVPGKPVLLELINPAGPNFVFFRGALDQNGAASLSILIESSIPSGTHVIQARTVINKQIVVSDPLVLTFN